MRGSVDGIVAHVSTVALERWLLVGLFVASFVMGAGLWPSPARDARVRALVAVLSEPGKAKPAEQARAITELGHMGPTAGAAVPVLIDYLSDKGNRSEATVALLGIGPRRALDPLIAALKREDGQVASSAAAVIAAFGRAAARARPALLTALERPDVRQWAGHAVNAIDGVEDDIARSAKKREWMP